MADPSQQKLDSTERGHNVASVVPPLTRGPVIALAGGLALWWAWVVVDSAIFGLPAQKDGVTTIGIGPIFGIVAGSVGIVTALALPLRYSWVRWTQVGLLSLVLLGAMIRFVPPTFEYFAHEIRGIGALVGFKAPHEQGEEYLAWRSRVWGESWPQGLKMVGCLIALAYLRLAGRKPVSRI